MCTFLIYRYHSPPVDAADINRPTVCGIRFARDGQKIIQIVNKTSPATKTQSKVRVGGGRWQLIESQKEKKNLDNSPSLAVVSDSFSFGHSLLRLCRITSLRCSTDRAALIRNSFPPPICNSIWDNAFNEDLLNTSIFKKKIKSINHFKNFKTKINSIPFGSA